MSIAMVVVEGAGKRETSIPLEANEPRASLTCSPEG